MTLREEQNDKLYSIYRYTDPRDQEIIYIGLTNDPDRRHREHTSKNGLLYPLTQELAYEGRPLIFDILETTIGIKNAFRLERKYIQQYKPLFNVLNNATGIRERKEIEKYREDIATFMEQYKFSLEEALIWHHQFYGSEGGWYTYQMIRQTAIIMQQRLQNDVSLTESEILDIALDVTNFYEEWESLWDQLWVRLRRKVGVEGE